MCHLASTAALVSEASRQTKNHMHVCKIQHLCFSNGFFAYFLMTSYFHKLLEAHF